jgi:hypothetical protein
LADGDFGQRPPLARTFQLRGGHHFGRLAHVSADVQFELRLYRRKVFGVVDLDCEGGSPNSEAVFGLFGSFVTLLAWRETRHA